MFFFFFLVILKVILDISPVIGVVASMVGRISHKTEYRPWEGGKCEWST